MKVKTLLFSLLCACGIMLSVSVPAMASSGSRCAVSGCYGFYRNGFCSSNSTHYEEPTAVDGVYRIANGGQLYWFASLVNKGSQYAEAVLTQNITVNNSVLKSDGSCNKSGSLRAWTPIGTTTYSYRGTFDGQGYTISGLWREAGSGSYVGLFGYLYSMGQVRNVTVTDSYFQAHDYVGAIVGHNYGGTITNCHNLGSTVYCFYESAGGIVGDNRSTVSGCTNSGLVKGSGFVGGIAGSSWGPISDCTNSGSVNVTPNSGRSVEAGGIVAYNHGDVTRCHNSGSVTASTKTGYEAVGGIVCNLAKGTISHCSNTGTLTSGREAGGIVGVIPSKGAGNEDVQAIINCFSACVIDCANAGGIVYQNSGSVIDCYYDRTLCPRAGIGTTTSETKRSEAYGRTSDKFASGEIAYLLQGDQGEAIWGQNIDGPGEKDAVPVLGGPKVYYGDRGTCAVGYSNSPLSSSNHPHTYENGFCTVCGSYEAAPEVDGVHQISNAGQLYWFGELVNDGEETASAILTGDITVNTDVLKEDGTLNSGSFRPWIPIGVNRYLPFNGSFDGNEKTVSGLYFNDAEYSYVGLIGCGKVTVKNVTVADSYFRGMDYVGSVLGHWGAYYGASTIHVVNCHSSSTVSGAGSYVGGIVGSGSVSGCTNSGAVSGAAYVGGVVGSGTAAGSSNTGGVVGGIGEYTGGVVGSGGATACSNTGTVDDNGGKYTGGISGNGTVTDCTNSGAVIGVDNYVGGVVGYTSKQAAGCVNTGSVTGGGDYTGGISGGGRGENCVNRGTVTGSDYVGGVTGQGNAIRCVNSGTVTGSSYVGGISGLTYSMDNCYNLGTVTGSGCVGGLVGSVSYKSYTVKNSYHSGAVIVAEGAEFAGALVGEMAGSFANCYFDGGLCTLPAAGGDAALTGSEAKTTAEFASGMVAFLLQGEQEEQIWGQNIDGEGEKDPHPVLGGPKVYHGYLSCAEDAGVVYSNYQTQEVKPSHDLEVVVKEATCTEDGYEDYSCQNCSYTYRETLAATGHTEVVDKAVEPTCTETGLEEGSHCDVCGAVIVKQKEIPATGHTEVVDKAVEPTCGATGLTEGSHCSVCDAVLVKQEEIPATGQHGYQLDAEVPPTCTETGLTAGASCPTCGYIHLAQEEIPATGHTEVVDKAVEPTCTATGLTEGKHCSVCKKVLIAQEEVPMADHTPVTDPEVPATCAETGLTEGSHCGVCGLVLTAQKEIPKKNHTVVIDYPKPPTCTEPGAEGTGMHCSVCGTILVAQEEIAPLGHSYGDWYETDEATCTEAGEERRDCDKCDHYETKEIKAKGHSYAKPTFAWKDDYSCSATGTCSGCGETTVDCVVTSDNSVVGKLVVTAAVELGGQRYTDSLTITGTVEKDGTITITLPEQLSREKMLIILAGYQTSGRMVDCQFAAGLKGLSAAGEKIQVFFLDQGKYSPLLAALWIKK